MLCSLYLRHLWRLSVRVTNPSTASSPNCCFSDRGWAKRLQGEELSLSISTSKDHSTSNTLWSAFSTTMLFIKIRKSMCVSLKFLIWLHIQQQHKQSVLWLYPQGNKRVLTTIPCCECWQLSVTICGPMKESQLMIARTLHSTRFLGRLLEKRGWVITLVLSKLVQVTKYLNDRDIDGTFKFIEASDQCDKP